jgi:hypothetical protein
MERGYEARTVRDVQEWIIPLTYHLKKEGINEDEKGNDVCFGTGFGPVVFDEYGVGEAWICSLW